MTLMTQARLDAYAVFVSQMTRVLDARHKERTLALVESQRDNAKRLYRRMRQALGLHGKKQTQAEADAELPRPLRWLLRELRRRLADLFDELTAARLTPTEWRNAVKRVLAEHHVAALMAGLGSEVVPAKAWQGVVDQVNVQVEFLNNFKVEIQDDAEFRPGWEKRARSYAESIKKPYWTGRTKLLPLPAMPGEGSQCEQGCNCQWEVKPVSVEQGDYDAYWRLERGSKHCQTCLQRAADWQPLRIRGGVLQ